MRLAESISEPTSTETNPVTTEYIVIFTPTIAGSIFFNTFIMISQPRALAISHIKINIIIGNISNEILNSSRGFSHILIKLNAIKDVKMLF